MQTANFITAVMWEMFIFYYFSCHAKEISETYVCPISHPNDGMNNFLVAFYTFHLLINFASLWDPHHQLRYQGLWKIRVLWRHVRSVMCTKIGFSLVKILLRVTSGCQISAGEKRESCHPHVGTCNIHNLNRFVYANGFLVYASCSCKFGTKGLI